MPAHPPPRDGALTACGLAGAATGALDGAVGGVHPELMFHLAALGALGGLAVGWPWSRCTEALWQRPRGRRLLRDGPFIALLLLPAVALLYAAERHLDLDAVDPRIAAIPVLFIAGARLLHLAVRRAAKGRIGRRALVAAWVALATAFGLSVHSLASRPGLVTDAIRRSEVGHALLGSVRSSRWLDRDADGYPSALCSADCDCDDGDPSRHPAAIDHAGDGIDQDCSGADARPAPTPDPKPARPAAAAAALAVSPPAAVVRPGRRGEPEGGGPTPTPTPTSPLPARATGGRPDLLLITVDTLRADHLHCYGYARNTSPRIDALAHAGTRFAQARSQGSMTVWSLASLVTGRYFTELERDDHAWPTVRAPGPHLGERLAARGYHTIGVAPQFYLRRRYGLPRGFARWDTRTVKLRAPFRHHVTGDLVTDRAVALLDDLPADRPVLLWVHYGDPHSDYLYHPDFSLFGRDRKGLYDGEIRFDDHQLGRLLDAWHRLARARPLVGVLTADHGENLIRAEDHGRLYHGTDLFDDLLHVPLVVWGAGVARRVVETPVGLIDVLPTLMELAGAPADATLQGRSLVPWLRGESPPHPPVFSERPRPAAGALKAMVAWPHKLIWLAPLNVYSLYDLAADPDETVDLFGQDPARDRPLIERFLRWRTRELKSRPPG